MVYMEMEDGIHPVIDRPCLRIIDVPTVETSRGRWRAGISIGDVHYTNQIRNPALLDLSLPVAI